MENFARCVHKAMGYKGPFVVQPRFKEIDRKIALMKSQKRRSSSKSSSRSRSSSKSSSRSRSRSTSSSKSRERSSSSRRRSSLRKKLNLPTVWYPPKRELKSKSRSRSRSSSKSRSRSTSRSRGGSHSRSVRRAGSKLPQDDIDTLEKKKLPELKKIA